jgi:hypothetical protein
VARWANVNPVLEVTMYSLRVRVSVLSYVHCMPRSKLRHAAATAAAAGVPIVTGADMTCAPRHLHLWTTMASRLRSRTRTDLIIIVGNHKQYGHRTF